MTNEPANTGFAPDYASPPGESIEDLLEENSMTQVDLARRLGVSTKHLNQVIKGVAPVSAELALALEMVFGVPAAFWTTREAIYRTRLAKQCQATALDEAVSWAKQFPLREMKTRGLLPTDAKAGDLVEALLRFLGIASPSQWKEPQVAYRKSAKFESDSHALATWLRLGEIAAKEIPAAPYDPRRFSEVLQSARGWTRLDPDEWHPKLVEGCASAGVCVVITEHFSKAKVNGATRWLAPDRALIQLSLRYRWEDVFWFTFFHEAGHVLKHRKKSLFIEADRRRGAVDDPELDRAEIEADRFAADTLIPPQDADELLALLPPEIPDFATKLDISPAIVVGRMQHDGLIPFSQGNQYRRRFEFVGAS